MRLEYGMVQITKSTVSIVMESPQSHHEVVPLICGSLKLSMDFQMET